MRTISILALLLTVSCFCSAQNLSIEVSVEYNTPSNNESTVTMSLVNTSGTDETVINSNLQLDFDNTATEAIQSTAPLFIIAQKDSIENSNGLFAWGFADFSSGALPLTVAAGDTVDVTSAVFQRSAGSGDMLDVTPNLGGSVLTTNTGGEYSAITYTGNMSLEPTSLPLIVEKELGIDILSEDVLVYPTVFNDEITIEYGYPKESSLSIFNINGLEVFNTTIDRSVLTISAADLPAGAYVMRINSSSNDSITHKLFKY